MLRGVECLARTLSEVQLQNLVLDGVEELLTAGNCHICKKGSGHSIINTGNEDLELFTVVVER